MKKLVIQDSSQPKWVSYVGIAVLPSLVCAMERFNSAHLCTSLQFNKVNTTVIDQLWVAWFERGCTRNFAAISRAYTCLLQHVDGA